MSGSQGLVRCIDDEAVAARVAADLVWELYLAQRAGRTPSVVLTGGTISRLVHRAVLTAPGAADVRWAAVEFWWGDERYVPATDPERNAGQAYDDLLGRLPLDFGNVHVMPSSDDAFPSVTDAAASYSSTLVSRRSPDEPWFDVLMLGIGPDGHCASLFPGRPEVTSSSPVVAVEDSPKAPPTRISLGMSTLGRARQVWFVATGSAKADAVAASVRGTDVARFPAAGPRGTVATRWYVDSDAAAHL